jgi:hypothetical protein
MAFVSKALIVKRMGLSIHEKEFMAISMVVERWRYYLEHDQFLIKTDSESLKYLLKQKIHAPLQRKEVTKLVGAAAHDSSTAWLSVSETLLRFSVNSSAHLLSP